MWTEESKRRMVENHKKAMMEKYGVDNPAKLKEVQQKMRKTSKERYGSETYTQSDEYKEKRAKIEEKKRKTCIEKYGVPVSSQAESVKERNKRTCIQRYGVDSFTKTKEFQERQEEIQYKLKKTCLERYGVERYLYTDEFKQKEYDTKKKNKTFNSSKPEKELEKYFKENNIEYIYQYISELYPFRCDFYLQKYDLYIELNIFWHHGKRPYTGSKEDLKKIEKWKKCGTESYLEAIKTWTIRDVEKRETAKKNKLNYLEIFEKENMIKLVEKRIKRNSGLFDV